MKRSKVFDQAQSIRPVVAVILSMAICSPAWAERDGGGDWINNGPDLTGLPASSEQRSVSRGADIFVPCNWCCPPHICGINGPELTGIQIAPAEIEHHDDDDENRSGSGNWINNGPELTGVLATAE